MKQTVDMVRLNFLISALHHGAVISTAQVLSWMKKQNEEVQTKIEQVPLSQLKGWEYRDDKICHNSGKFFSIDGFLISTNDSRLLDVSNYPVIHVSIF